MLKWSPILSLKILLIRHADAGLRDEFALTGLSDDLRPVSAKGKKDFKKIAAVIQKIHSEIEIIATSPLVRTTQTAQLLKSRFRGAKLVKVTELEPGNEPESIHSWLRDMGRVNCVALVGHEPELGQLLSWFVVGRKKPFFKFKKGGFVLIRFDNLIEKGSARLICNFQPSHLKKIKSVIKK